MAVVVAAGLIVALLSVPAAHASTGTAEDAECSAYPIVYLVHGINQGPTVAQPQLSQSPELSSVVTDLENNTDVPPFYWQTIVYPAASTLNVAATWDTYMNDGERNLQSSVAYWNARTCSGDEHIALVGYSMGAWVIDKWLQDHQSEWGEVSAVTLFGDPCWTSSGDNEGLVRLFLYNYGCGPGNDYPYPAAKSSVPFPVHSYTLNLDPVTGYGFRGGGNRLVPTVEARRAHQLAVAVGCKNTSCPHYDYQVGQSGAGLVQDGANVVAAAFAKYA